MSPSQSHSIDTAIAQLRAEIIAPDWQLSPQRITHLRAALTTLTSFFAERSHALALLKMASSVVDHIDHHEAQAPALDFLKEDMAHIVSLYEDDIVDADRDKDIVKRAYKRFRRLNISIAAESSLVPEQKNNTLRLLNKLENLAEQAGDLPALLAQTGPLSPEETKRAAALLGKISAAINVVWARLPSSHK